MRSILMGLFTVAVPAAIMVNMHWRLRYFERREQARQLGEQRRIFRHED